jgi:AraC-like DNA-binding protein
MIIITMPLDFLILYRCTLLALFTGAVRFCTTVQGNGVHFRGIFSYGTIEGLKKLMHDNNKNIILIAYESGFQSLSLFNSVFRKILMMHPAPSESESTLCLVALPVGLYYRFNT